jgi:hypothetical protein
VFRLRPLPFEATASYVQRLATAYQLTLPQFLDGAGITLHRHGALPAAELILTPGAARQFAALARVPLPHLIHALPHLSHCDAAHGTEAVAHWKRLEAGQQPVRACTLCTRHRSHDATDAAWVHRPPHRLTCPRHHQAAPDPRLTSPLHTRAAPELVAAHHAHQRLLRHPHTLTAWTAARAITTRWYDHQQHLTDRWRTRLARLRAANPHLATTGSASPALLTRDLVTYPETVALARAQPSSRTGHTATPTRPSAASPTDSDCPAWPATRTIASGPSSPTHATDQPHRTPKPPRAQPPLDAPPHLRENQDQSHTTTGSHANHPNNQTEHDPRPRQSPPNAATTPATNPNPKDRTPDQNTPAL